MSWGSEKTGGGLLWKSTLSHKKKIAFRIYPYMPGVCVSPPFCPFILSFLFFRTPPLKDPSLSA